MSRINKGQLRVVTDSRVYIFPPPGSPADKINPARDLKLELRVLNPTFWIRLCLACSLGFAEAYMYGDAECDDLPALFEVCPLGFCLAFPESDASLAVYVQQRIDGWSQIHCVVPP